MVIRGLLLEYCSKWRSPMPTESVDEVLVHVFYCLYAKENWTIFVTKSKKYK